MQPIKEWLDRLGLARYAEVFVENDVDFEVLRLLAESDLERLGISLGHRKKLLKAIADLNGAETPTLGPTAEAINAPSSDVRLRTPDGERRQATILIADISGFTTLCGRLDPERVQELLSHFYDVTDRIIADYGGHVIDHAGDGTLAAFGAPIAHDNDSERAVRAAFDMHSQVIVDPTGQPLKLHIGIAGGEVVAATIATGMQPKYAVTGEAVNLAARLNAIARAGQTLLTDPIWHSVSHAFDALPLGEVSIKGLDKPVSLWRLAGMQPAATARLPLIGRQAELRQLLGALDSIQDERSGLAVCIRGEAGIGKSRLVEELRKRGQSRGVACHTGFVLDFGVGKRRDAIPAILKEVLDVSPQGDEAALQAGVQRALAGGLITREQHMGLNDLLELPQSAEQRMALEAMDNTMRVQRMGEALIGILQRCALQKPRLLVVEDIHWASPDLLRYLALLTRMTSESRIMLVMTSRFEGYPIDKGWRASTHGTSLITVDLGPLSPDESRLLAETLMESSNPLSPKCVERAEGNPLFLEQLLRNAAESQASSLPASIQSLVLARMDRLAPRDKIALQVASVLGKRFGLDTLRDLIDDRQYGCDALLDADLVRPEGGDYVFAHALIHEGVYSSLLNARKREFHRSAAQWFGEQEPILRAEHLDRASDAGAAEAYLVAANAQAKRFLHEPALRLAARGLEVALEDSVRCSLLLLRGDLLRDTGSSTDSLVAFKSALELAADDSQRYQAWMGIVAGYRVTSDIAAAMAALDRAQEVAERLGVAAQRSRIHHLRGNLFFVTGDGVSCRKEHEAALHYAQQAEDSECEAQALSGLGDAQYLQGRMLSALDSFSRCVDLCERAGLAKVQIPNLCMVGHCLYYANRMDESIENIRLTLTEARRMGQAQTEIFAQESLGLLLAGRGDYGSAEEALFSGIPLARKAGARRYLSAMLYALAQVRLAHGARGEAREHLEEALALAQQTGMAFSGPLILSGVACAAQDLSEAKSALTQGEAALRQPCMSHCHLFFYRNAIDVSLRWREWNEALRYAAMLDHYVRTEPLPWATLIVKRAHGLAAAGAGKRSDALLSDLRLVRAEIERVGIPSAVPDIDIALSA